MFYGIPNTHLIKAEGLDIVGNNIVAELDKAKISHKPFPLDFNYGYAITCHKAQGSEWDNIVVMEEWFPNDLETHCRWLYTALTRASEKVVIVR